MIAALKAGGEYHEKTEHIKNTSKEDQAAQKKELKELGPPFLHVWVSVLEVLIQASQTPRAVKEALDKYWTEQVLKVNVLGWLTKCGYAWFGRPSRKEQRSSMCGLTTR